MKYIPKKCVKTKLSGELKKYGIFDWTVKNIEKNIIDQSHIVHKTWQHLYRLDLWNVAVSSGRFIYMLSSITIDTTTLPRRCDTPRLIVPRFFLSLPDCLPPALLHFSTLWIPSVKVQCYYWTSGNHSHPHPRSTALSLNIRANAYRNQSLNDSIHPGSTSSCCDVVATLSVIYNRQTNK